MIHLKLSDDEVQRLAHLISDALFVQLALSG